MVGKRMKADKLQSEISQQVPEITKHFQGHLRAYMNMHYT